MTTDEKNVAIAHVDHGSAIERAILHHCPDRGITVVEPGSIPITNPYKDLLPIQLYSHRIGQKRNSKFTPKKKKRK